MASPERFDEPDTGVAEVHDWRFRQLIESLNDYAVILLDPDGFVISWNRGAEIIKGYAAREIVGKHFSTFYTDEANAVGHPDSELSIARATGRYSEDGWRIRKDGSRFWAHVEITAIYAGDGQLEGYGKVTRDLTERKQAEEQAANTLALLRTTAKTDPLTGALNRRALDEALQAHRRSERPFCVAMIDIDNFKGLNDQFGHAVGDRLLRQTVIAWAAALREGDLLCRYGGDEFVALLVDCALPEGQLVVERLREATPETCTCSVGVAAWQPGMSSSDVLDLADLALYEQKGIPRATHDPAPAPDPDPVSTEDFMGEPAEPIQLFKA